MSILLQTQVFLASSGLGPPVEVKSSSRPGLGDARHVITFQKEYGERAGAGLLLHTGETLKWIAPRVLAAPWWRVL